MPRYDNCRLSHLPHARPDAGGAVGGGGGEGAGWGGRRARRVGSRKGEGR